MSDDPSSAPVGIDDWLQKVPDLKKAIQEDIEATRQSVDDKVSDLQANIDRRKTEISSDRRHIAAERLALEGMRLEWKRRQQAIRATQLKSDRLQLQNQKDIAQIEEIKSRHQAAESRLREFQETLNSLNGMMRPQPTTNNQEAFRHYSILANNNSPPSPRPSTTFEEVYAGGKPVQEIICLDHENYFVLACSEHGIEFAYPSFQNAVDHVFDHHPSLGITPEQVLRKFGVSVIGCEQSQMEENNKACSWNEGRGIPR